MHDRHDATAPSVVGAPPDMKACVLPECQLFGTLGCHLCEQAQALLMPFVARGLVIELVDIAEQSEWLEAYALLIPVLRRSDSGAELRWPFDGQQVAQLLGN